VCRDYLDGTFDPHRLCCAQARNYEHRAPAANISTSTLATPPPAARLRAALSCRAVCRTEAGGYMCKAHGSMTWGMYAHRPAGTTSTQRLLRTFLPTSTLATPTGLLQVVSVLPLLQSQSRATNSTCEGCNQRSQQRCTSISHQVPASLPAIYKQCSSLANNELMYMRHAHSAGTSCSLSTRHDLMSLTLSHS
jgi:hypothetical protein